MKPGPELDRLIAEKVMGWHIENGDTWAPTDWQVNDPRYPARYEEEEAIQWRPSTNIACAWMVVEKVTEDQAAHVFRDPVFAVPRQWGCSFERDGVLRAVTAPLAICLAALQVVG